MAATSATVEATAGRGLRSVRTRRAIIDALLSLIDDGELAPTGRQVAERAGVGLRTVFQHFEDLEALHMEAATRHIERIAPLLETVGSDGSSVQRVEAMVRVRSKLFERITPVRRAVLNAEFRFETLANLIRVADDQFQADVERVFGPELDRQP